jgi:TPR repeat protein
LEASTIQFKECNPVCHWLIGEMYLNGIAAEKDIQRGLHNLTIAANLSIIPACIDLGQIYEFGRGIEANLVIAYACYSRVLECDVQYTEFFSLRKLAEEGIARIFSSPKSKRVQDDFRKHQKELVIQRRLALLSVSLTNQFNIDSPLLTSHAGAHRLLSLVFDFCGYSFLPIDPLATKSSNTVDLNEQIDDLDLKTREDQDLANDGDIEAQYRIARVYELEASSDTDHILMVKWYQKAAVEGHAPSQFRLGVLFLLGKGVYRKPREALKWINMAAAQGYAPALMRLSSLYRQNRDVALDSFKAFCWSKMASDFAPQPEMSEISYLAGEDLLQLNRPAADIYKEMQSKFIHLSSCHRIDPISQRK